MGMRQCLSAVYNRCLQFYLHLSTDSLESMYINLQAIVKSLRQVRSNLLSQSLVTARLGDGAPVVQSAIGAFRPELI
jgi:hypothetical protein